LLLCTFSIGIGIGSMICNRLVRGMVTARYVPLAALMMTVFSIDLYFASGNVVTPTLSIAGELFGATEFLSEVANWRVVGDLFGIAVSGGIYIVPLYAIMQTSCKEEERSRIIAANNILNSLFMVMSALGAMILIMMDFTLPEIFLVIAILNAMVAIYISQLLPQELVQSIIRTILRALYRVEIIGLENYRKAGNKTVIIANHTSYLDALLLGAFLPDPLTYAINTHIAQKWWARPAVAFFDLLPLDPTNPMATKTMIKAVQGGRRCVIFPEGRITMTGALMKVYEGPGTISYLADAPLLPIRIEGADRSPFSRLKGLIKIRLFPKITINIQEPVTFDVPQGMSARARRSWIGGELYDVMSDVIFKSSNMERTLFHALIDAKKTHGGGHTVLEDVERAPFNYKKLILGSFVIGRKIAAMTERGERVGLMLPNAVGAVVVFFACLAYGRVPAMLNFSTGSGNMVAALKAAEIRTILTSKRFIDLGGLEETVEILSEYAGIVYLEDVRQTIGFGDKVIGLLSIMMPNMAHNFVAEKPQADDDGVVLFTSGSEGTPKGVVLSHKNIQSNRYQLSARVDFSPSDTVFNALPIFHSFGLTGGLLLPILSGLKIFLYPSPLHYRIVPELVYDSNATIMFGTDTFLSGYARFAHPYDFYSMRYVFAGAEKLKPQTKSLWAEKYGVRILEGYGATETSPVLSTNTTMQARSGTVGRLMPGIEYKLEAVPGIEVGGKLIVKGPNIMKGYLRAENPGFLERPQGGWYDTGDIVEIDDEGYIKIVGRAKRFAKIAGEMVSLTAVEGIVSALWPDESHAVVALPDPKKGEKLILITTSKAATKENVRDGVKADGHSELLSPKVILLVDEVPVLGTGKTDYVGAQKLVKEKFGE
ncbi:MAG: AMP-binding protein, partial [Emcibacteraceae bacterium]|nr:AMP-binding protein [Emcibacteraceae bacterium]